MWIDSRAFWAGLGALWLVFVVLGLGAVAAYDNTPGVAARASVRWPAASRITHATDRPTLVMLAHPQCTCTRASVAELQEVMARAHVRPHAYVVFIKPGVFGDDWEKTELWQRAARIPGVTVVRDDDGLEAARFGAETSGQTFLYDASGQLLFSGGTTGSRGHAGDNAGRAAILAMLNSHDPQQAGSSVFGCPLFAPHDRHDGPVTTHESHRN
jgi:hypothetical protein